MLARGPQTAQFLKLAVFHRLLIQILFFLLLLSLSLLLWERAPDTIRRSTVAAAAACYSHFSASYGRDKTKIYVRQRNIR